MSVYGTNCETLFASSFRSDSLYLQLRVSSSGAVRRVCSFEPRVSMNHEMRSRTLIGLMHLGTRSSILLSLSFLVSQSQLHCAPSAEVSYPSLHLLTMGVFSSSPVRSTEADVKDNVLWTLNESAFWDSECALVKSILNQAIAVSDQKLAEKGGPGPPSAQEADVDRTADARPSTVNDLDNYCHSVINGMDLAAGDDIGHRTQPYPQADPAHAHMARRAFATAATQNLQSSVDTIKSSELATSAHLAHYSQAEDKESEVVVIEGPLDTRNTGTASPFAVNVMDVTTTNPSAFSSKWLVQQARVELAAKFLFIYALLDKVVVAAAHCYRLQQRTKGDSKGDVRLTSLTKTMEPRQPAVQPTEDERVRASLKLSLLSFDRAKAALHWLRRDYELSYASYRVNELLLWTMDARNELLYDIDTLPVLPRSTMDVLVDTRAVNANAHDIQQLNALLAVLQKKATEVEIAVLRNEKSSLDIALDYLDNDGDGRVRAEDCTDFDQRLMFPILSGHHDYITRKSMRQGVLELSAVIERNSNKVKAIIALGTQLGKKDKVELNASLDAIHTNRSRLHHIYQSLHQAFVHHLFANVSEEVTQSAIHIGRVR